MFIDESIRFALKEYLYRENISKKFLAENIGVHDLLIDKWIDGIIEYMSTDVWLKLYEYIKYYLKNPKLHEETVFKQSVKKVDCLKDRETYSYIADMKYEELCEKLADSLRYLSEKYSLNVNFLSFQHDLYLDILNGSLVPSVDDIKEICSAFSLSSNASEFLINLAELISRKEVSMLKDIIVKK